MQLHFAHFIIIIWFETKFKLFIKFYSFDFEHFITEIYVKIELINGNLVRCLVAQDGIELEKDDLKTSRVDLKTSRMHIKMI